MKFNLKNISHNFNEDGETTDILVRFEYYENEQYLNANVKLLLEDMGELGFNQTAKQITAIAKAKIKSWA